MPSRTRDARHARPASTCGQRRTTVAQHLKRQEPPLAAVPTRGGPAGAFLPQILTAALRTLFPVDPARRAEVVKPPAPLWAGLAWTQASQQDAGPCTTGRGAHSPFSPIPEATAWVAAQKSQLPSPARVLFHRGQQLCPLCRKPGPWLPLSPALCPPSGQSGWGCVGGSLRGNSARRCSRGAEGRESRDSGSAGGDPGGLKDIGLSLDPHVLEGICLAVPVIKEKLLPSLNRPLGKDPNPMVPVHHDHFGVTVGIH